MRKDFIEAETEWLEKKMKKKLYRCFFFRSVPDRQIDLNIEII